MFLIFLSWRGPFEATDASRCVRQIRKKIGDCYHTRIRTYNEMGDSSTRATPGENDIVFEVGYDQTFEPWDPAKVRECAVRLRGLATDLGATEARRSARGDAELRRFSEHYVHMFSMLTDPETQPHIIDAIVAMIDVRNDPSLTPADATSRSYEIAMRHAMM
jgi:hypothetical protein